MNRERYNVDRKFGYSVIKWEIANYCLSPCELDWTFRTPEFYIRGFELTKWRMFLRRILKNEGNYRVLFRLERLPCKYYVPDVQVDCVLNFCDHLGNIKDAEFKHLFRENSKFEKELEKTNLTPINAFHRDEFRIRCEIMVYFASEEETFHPCKDLGIEQLSEDLGRLYELNENFDLTVIIGNDTMRVHKPILYYRITEPDFKNRIFASDEINFDKSDNHSAIDKLFRFLYTANMKYVVKEPSISVYKSALEFEVEPIIAYFEPDQLRIVSTVQTEEYNLTWTIHSIRNRSEIFLVTPLMMTETMDTRWRLKVYPKGFGNRQKYIGIFLEIEMETPKYICVELFLKSNLGGRLYYRKHKRIERKEIFGLKDFLDDEDLKSYLHDDSLIVCLRLRIQMGGELSSVEESTVKCKPFSEQQNYDRLSDDMFTLYSNSEFSDLQLRVTEDELVARGHACVFAVRYPPILPTFDSWRENVIERNTVRILREYISFLYCGKLRKRMTIADMFSLYGYAEEGNATTLKRAILDQLLKIFSNQSSERILEFTGNVNALSFFASKIS